MDNKFYNVNRGFTLIELAVVLVIIGILLSGILGTLGSRIESTRKNETKKQLEDIKMALIGYSFVYKYLPCPDCADATGNCIASVVGDGIADYNAGECREEDGVGNIPWVTLGIGKSDSWGTRYRYAVQKEYADEGIEFALDGVNGPPGSVIIREPNFVIDATGGTSQALATNVVAVIFSHGENGYDGTSDNGIARTAIPAANIDEAENTDDDATFYKRPETAVGAAIAGGEFDDILIWISEFELKAKMVEAGKLP